MGHTRHKHIRLGFETLFISFLCLLLILVGCVPHQSYYPEQKKSADSYKPRMQLGTVGLVMGNNVPKVTIPRPAKGWKQGLMRGSGIGASVGFDLAVDMCRPDDFSGGSDPLTAILVIMAVCAGSLITFPTVGVVVGGIGGTALAEPADEVEAAEATTEEILAIKKLYKEIESRLFKRSINQSHYSMVLLRESERASLKKGAISNIMEYRGLDTLMEIDIERMGYVAESSAVNPDFSLYIKLQATLFQKNGKILDSENFVYKGGSYSFTEWASNEGWRLRTELGRGYQSLSIRILNRMLGRPETS